MGLAGFNGKKFKCTSIETAVCVSLEWVIVTSSGFLCSIEGSFCNTCLILLSTQWIVLESSACECCHL